ncbi:hypothetical protein FACS1894204_12460 [Synergistales bacterium]|nr:hypothetical protein FACS1894204_12460 [Synergistales bacterium]
MAFHKAERKKAKLRLGIVGPAGSGKTYSALLMAFGLGGRVALIDTENGSGDLYAHLGDYDVCAIEAPYTVKKYLDALDEAERSGYDVIIIDSLSHAWAGEGGLLDQQGKIADSSSSKNSYTAWRTVTPMHYKLVEAMLTSKCHIIATMRAKTEYTQDKDDKGKTVIRKVGMAPVQRDGMDYEFTLVFDVDTKHNAMASKDRTSLFDGSIFTPSKETGAALKRWLETGVEAAVNPSAGHTPSPEKPKQQTAKPSEAKQPTKAQNNNALKEDLYKEYLEVCGQPDHAKNAMLKVTEGRGSAEWTDEDIGNLGADLLRRKQEAATSTMFGSVRDGDPDIDNMASVDEAAQGF